MVSKNAGGTKRVTSLADALKLNFGMVTTARKKRGGNMSASVIINPINGSYARETPLETLAPQKTNGASETEEAAPAPADEGPTSAPRQSRVRADTTGSPQRLDNRRARGAAASARPTTPRQSAKAEEGEESDYDDGRAHEVTQGRLVQGHIVDDDYASPATSVADGSTRDEPDPMTMSHASSFFAPAHHALGGSGDAANESDEEEDKLQDLEHTITLVGDVKNRTVFIVDDMIDKPSSWIAAAETVVKKGRAKKVYCIATHGVFGGDCLEQMQKCECIDTIVVTNSFPIHQERAKSISKLVVLDLSFLLAEAIRRNHYGESISPLYQHVLD